jgi:hypothetical chaperone protein
MRCGIDFGTSNSAIALPSGEVLRIDAASVEPRLFRSVLFFPEGETVTYAGAAAVTEYLAHGEGRFIQSAKAWLPSPSFTSTHIRSRAIRLEELVAILLRRIREAGEAAASAPLREAVLGRPAVFSSEPERDALAQRRLEEAARLAGFDSVEFVIEPIAAALAYEAQLSRDEMVLVADFGAGTSDFTLMRLGPGRRGRPDRAGDIVGAAGCSVAGDAFDAEIMRHKLLRHFGAGSSYESMGKRLAMPSHILGKLLAWHEMSLIRERSTQKFIDDMLHTTDAPAAVAALQDLVTENLGYRLFRAIEQAKIELGSVRETRIVFDEARIHVDERISRDEFESFTKPLRATLDATVAELLAATETDEGAVDAVFLTGGTSQLPSVRRLFEARFGRERLRTADAFTSVAEGLGRAASGFRLGDAGARTVRGLAH